MVLGLKGQRSRLGLGLQLTAIRRILYECLLVIYCSTSYHTSTVSRVDIFVSCGLSTAWKVHDADTATVGLYHYDNT